MTSSPVHEIISRQLCSALADVINASSSSYNSTGVAHAGWSLNARFFTTTLFVYKKAKVLNKYVEPY